MREGKVSTGGNRKGVHPLFKEKKTQRGKSLIVAENLGNTVFLGNCVRFWATPRRSWPPEEGGSDERKK